jgi:hypothetical protein
MDMMPKRVNHNAADDQSQLQRPHAENSLGTCCGSLCCSNLQDRPICDVLHALALEYRSSSPASIAAFVWGAVTSPMIPSEVKGVSPAREREFPR